MASQSGIERIVVRPAGYPAGLTEIRLPEHMFRAADGSAVLYGYTGEPRHSLDRATPDLPSGAIGPDAALVARAPAPRSTWAGTVALSLAFHVAVAGLFVVLTKDEGVLIEGGAASELAASGSATADQLAEGEAVDVEIMEMASLEAEPQPAETLQTVKPATETLTAAPPETMQPVDPAERLAPIRADAVPKPAEPERLAPAEPAERIEPTPPALAARPEPEILSATTAKPVENEMVAPPPVERSEPVREVEPVEMLKPAETLAAVTPVALETPPEEPVEALAPVEPEPPLREEPELAAETTAVPTPRPEPEPVEQVAEARPEKPRQKRTEPRPVTPAQKAETPKKTKPAAGSGGRNASDARKGDASGSDNGRSTASVAGKSRSAAGNAAVSNYPGKVVSKLRRALRYPAEARRNKLRGEVHVAFTVSGGGGVGGVRIVRSSGSPVLDKAALDTVRRAAPFPAIPDGAGRSSWPFTVPLAFTR